MNTLSIDAYGKEGIFKLYCHTTVDFTILSVCFSKVLYFENVGVCLNKINDR